MVEPNLSGGCQCGAVRYRISGPLANMQWDDFTVTRGAIARSASSDLADRGFCRECGTPLTYEGKDAGHLNIVLGTLDDPAAVRPAAQYGLEARMPWLNEVLGLPGETTEDAGEADALKTIRDSSHQHPDRDTDRWPAEQSGSQ